LPQTLDAHGRVQKMTEFDIWNESKDSGQVNYRIRRRGTAKERRRRAVLFIKNGKTDRAVLNKSVPAKEDQTREDCDDRNSLETRCWDLGTLHVKKEKDRRVHDTRKCDRDELKVKLTGDWKRLAPRYCKNVWKGG